MELKVQEIFTDYNSDGLAATFREFQGYVVKQFFPLVKTQIEKLYFARFDYPLLVFPVLLLALITLFSFWRKPTYWRAALTALPTGLLFYSYFHYWTYWIIVLILLFTLTLVLKHRDKQRLRGLLCLLLLTTLATLPYFINYLRFSKIESAHDYALRLGIAEGREIGLYALGFDYLLYLALAAVVYFSYWRSGQHSKAILLWSFLGAAAAVWNIQLITGFVPAPNNWKRTISPFLFIIFFVIIHDAISKLTANGPKTLAKAATLAIGLLAILVISKKVANAIEILHSPEKRIVQSYSFPQTIVESWIWINNNLSKEPRVLSNSFMTSLYLNSYTSARPFLPIGNISTQSTSQLEERFLLTNKVFGVGADTVRGELINTLRIDCGQQSCPANTEQNIGKNLWHLYFHYFRGGPANTYMAKPKSIPIEYVQNIMERYKKTSSNLSLTAADYVYVGPWEKQLGTGGLIRYRDNLKLIYKNAEVEIYKTYSP